MVFEAHCMSFPCKAKVNAKRLYDHIKQETFQMCAPASLQRQSLVKRARKQCR